MPAQQSLHDFTALMKSWPRNRDTEHWERQYEAGLHDAQSQAEGHPMITD